MKELELSEYNLEKMFKESLGFRKTYDILHTKINLYNVTDIDFLTPMITSIIFSCELYLKIILIYYKIDFRKKHSLKSLFDLLPTETKNSVKNTFNTECADKKYFEKVLKESNNSYTHFRYYFSYDDNMDVHLTFFEKFNTILFKQAKLAIFKN